MAGKEKTKKNGRENGAENMTGKETEQQILDALREERRRHPAMEQQDAVKFVFQAMLGPGHLLASRDRVEDYIAREMASLSPEGESPLSESLGPCWCRLSLYAAKEKGLSPAVLAAMMTASVPAAAFTRQDVLRFCRQEVLAAEGFITDPEALERIPEEGWLPSHSPAYREAYRPAYRVVSPDWIPCVEILRRVAAAPGKRVLVCLDGPCATGKTTLAGKLAEVLDAAVVHTDDYVIPHEEKTPERLAVPGGNCDAERLAREVAAPWKAGGPVVYRRYDCRRGVLLPEETLPEGRVLILEGSYCSLPAIRRYADVSLFLTAPWELREQRLLRRESPESMQRFRNLWIPLEDAYFKAFGLPDRDCLVL